MKTKLIVPSMLLSLLFTYSCGTKKELEASQKENEQLKTQVNELKSTQQAQQTQISQLSTQKTALEQDKHQCEQNLKLVTDAMTEEADQMKRVQDKLDAALINFQNHGVDIYRKDGLLYVSMSEELMYKTGSAKLDPKGKDVLKSLAGVLNQYPKLQVIVVGHTDSVMFKGGSDNLTLSTERANGVFRVLRDDFKVDPARLVAAGRGKYNPVASNATKEGRAMNRRTDIILNPDMTRIWHSAKK